MVRTATLLSLGIAALSTVATLVGMLSRSGPGPYEYTSIRGRTVRIYGRGIYQHMSADVAVQGIAQDYVTLFVGVPVLLIALLLYRWGSVRGKFVFAGALAYFLVTYLFYMVMGMYNFLFPVYILLTGLSFFAFLSVMLSLDLRSVSESFGDEAPTGGAGVFLISNSVLIALLWLSVIIPPLIDGTIYPVAVEHYTTLIVQGLDLSILLPAAFLSGLWLLRRRNAGYLLAPVYLVFLSILMTALTAKIVGMSLVGVDPGPAIFIIPIINLLSITFAISMVRSIRSSCTVRPIEST